MSLVKRDGNEVYVYRSGPSAASGGYFDRLDCCTEMVYIQMTDKLEEAKAKQAALRKKYDALMVQLKALLDASP